MRNPRPADAGVAGLDELSGDEQQMLEETDRFARGELYPLAPRMDHDGSDLV